MNYQETIDYLFTRLPMFSRIGAAAYKKDLTNTLELCAILNNPHKRFKSIHIAGTNGKGSVSHMLAAILQTAGYKTGLYTSPHLKYFRERIRINGQMIPEKFVIDFTEKIKPEIERIDPSFFEITVAMAFDYFAQEEVDVAVIETGLGGRLDSTNVITPELSVITNIGWDHMNMLGDTLEKIALEKAGIIKQGVPVIIGETLSDTLPVFEKAAKEKNAPLSIAENKWQSLESKWENHKLFVTVRNETTETYETDLPGIYQKKNLLTVLESCHVLNNNGWKINQEHIKAALSRVKKLTGLFGRWDIIRHSPLLVLDVAHNVNGIEQLIEQIRLTKYRQLHIILGFVKDKEIDHILRLLPQNATYYFTKAQIPRALPEEELRQKASRYNLKGNSFSTVNTALYASSCNAKKDDMIVVCGSIFLVGEVSLRGLKEIWGRDMELVGNTDWLEMVRFFD
jgi:dihydrofolate synthase/folylpolyglutamate synthase